MLKNLRIIMKTRFYGIPPKGCPRICQPKRSRMPHAGHILLMIYSFYNIKAAGEISGKSLYQIKHCYYYCNYPIRKTECSKHGENRLKRSLGHSRGQWRFAEHQVLAETFPLDQENRNFVRQVPGCLFSRTVPTPLRQDVRLAGVSDGAMADVLDLHPAIVKDEGFTRMVTGRLSAHSPVPLSHRYGGHQFGVWAGQLGDGRAHMLGEYVNSRGERWELQLKGSGLTPYSRRGDGYAVIRSSVREFLASEAMHYLGIPTSRAATLAVSSDPVWRDMFYNGNLKKEKAAVVLRLARSWFRIGSLEILAANQEYHLLRQLTEFIIKEYFSEAYISGENKILAFYSEVVSNTADMIAQWMSVGFAHGVCNTDNFSLLSITIDYGPFRFMDEYEPGMVPNTSDDEHRYSYEKQPDVGHFNLNKLRLALAPLLNHDQQIQMKHILNGYADIYKRKFMEIFRKKLGICSTSNDDEQLIALLLKMMSDKKADFTMTFRQLGDLTLGQIKHVKIPVELWAVHSISNHKWFKNWLAMYDSILDQCSHISDEERRYNMHKINPRYILRNWIAQAVIEKTEAGDFSLLQETLRILENPFSEQQTAELLGFADPPPTWASGLRVSCSS